MKHIIAFIILVAAASCIDPYYPDFGDHKSFLVVEGLITNEISSYNFRLSRTINEEDAIPEKITDADVFLTDEDDVQIPLQNCGDGTYKTDSTKFTGVIGKSYTLHILTSDGKEYLSESCTMYHVAEIDSVYYEKDTEISGNQGESLDGIRIYVDSNEGVENNQYFRWEFDEVWKFRIPSPQRFIYYADSNIVPIYDIKEYCWKENKSGEIIINSIQPGQTNSITREPILFIGTGESDRITCQYSILVKQYSVSKKEYDFWDKLKEINNSSGGIFDTQPYPINGNVHNISDPDEMVLGYFEVSAVSQKRIYIMPREMDSLSLPYYTYDCTIYPVSPENYPPAGTGVEPMTFDDIYEMFMREDEYSFVEPWYDTDGELQKLVFAYKVCSDCELTGTLEKPDFWIDLK